MNTNQLPTTADELPAFIFDHEGQSHRIRTVRGTDGQCWWPANDICNALGIGNSSRATRSLEPDEKGQTKLYTLGGPQTLTTVNQSGLFALVFQSRMKNARAFRQWVTGTVLPAIYRDGAYIRGEEKALQAATAEELRARLKVLEEVAAHAIDVKGQRGLCGLEERDARAGALRMLGKGRRPKRRQTPKTNGGWA